jgi:hypothetical protein
MERGKKMLWAGFMCAVKEERWHTTSVQCIIARIIILQIFKAGMTEYCILCFQRIIPRYPEI